MPTQCPGRGKPHDWGADECKTCAPVHAFAVYHWGCNEDDELGIVLQPTPDATPDPLGIFPTKEQAENAMERNWPGGEVRRVRIVEDPE